MGMKDLERQITAEAREVFKNKKLRVIEWSTGNIEPHEGEVVEKMPLFGIYVAIIDYIDIYFRHWRCIQWLKTELRITNICGSVVRWKS
jgi:hypothetical protein